MNVVTHEKPKSVLSAEEMERRRETVRRAVASSRIEGMTHAPEADPVFEAYVRGEIDAREIVPRLNRLRELHRA